MSGKAKTAAKKIKAKNEQPRPTLVWEMSENGLPLYKTSRGVVLECQAISMELTNMEQRIRDSIDWPDPPTYLARFGGPDSDEVGMAYDADSIVGAPPEDIEAWSAYLVDLDETERQFEARMNVARVRMFALEGTRIVSGAPDIEAWAAKQEYITGVPAPENPLDRQVWFFADACIGNQNEDIMGIYIGVSIASGADENRAAALERMFRARVEEAQAEAWNLAALDSEGDSTATE